MRQKLRTGVLIAAAVLTAAVIFAVWRPAHREGRQPSQNAPPNVKVTLQAKEGAWGSEVIDALSRAISIPVAIEDFAPRDGPGALSGCKCKEVALKDAELKAALDSLKERCNGCVLWHYQEGFIIFTATVLPDDDCMRTRVDHLDFYGDPGELVRELHKVDRRLVPLTPIVSVRNFQELQKQARVNAENKTVREILCRYCQAAGLLWRSSTAADGRTTVFFTASSRDQGAGGASAPVTQWQY
jgi:hypothetical protein